ncbi:SOS response-associated peptidase [Pseudoxanthobacter sp.]|uniref:SOS response-associated peptidase n=1 Tax=Pseudoxanthobacter sp. TaxID=1925742 RepID=UPI002FE3EC9E
MCGRFLLTAPPEAVAALFRVAGFHPFPPRYNIAPGQPIVIVREVAGRRRLELVRWGLLPGWVKDPGDFPALINARSETALEKPAFRAAMRHRRCLVPASGFYEWQRAGRVKQPMLIRPADGGLVGFAGLWEEWIDADGGVHETGAILTTAASAAIAPVHDRMPAVIAPADFDRWLDVTHVDARAAAGLLRPAAEEAFEIRPVSSRVNSAANDDPGLAEPAAPQPAAPQDAAPAPRRGRRGPGRTGGGGPPDEPRLL